jgi:HPr kinase/phosphorylase
VQNLTVGDVLERYGDRLALELVAGASGLSNNLASSDVHRPGLVLAGFVGLFTYDRAQVLGNSEMLYLAGLDSEKRRLVLETVCQFDIPCIVITDGNDVLPMMRELAESNAIPLLTTSCSTTKFSHLLAFYLDDIFAPSTSQHGTLVDVYGIGLLFIGPSGIGKSEIALDLVERGHRLVTDDIVFVSRKMQGILVGTSSETTREHMEIRGVGIINVRNMFGVRAVRLQKRVEVVVKLVEWDESAMYDRVGLAETTASILDVEIPMTTVPIYPGKNITVIAEAIALNYQLRIQGFNTARDFSQRLLERIEEKAQSKVSMRDDVE